MPPRVVTGLRPLRADRVGVALLVFRFVVGRWDLHASALPCSWADLQGGGGLMGHGDGGCGLVLRGSRGRAGMGTQNAGEVPIRVVHIGWIRGVKGTAVVAYCHAV